VRIGSLGKRDFRVQAGPGLIGPENVLQGNHVRGRIDSVNVDFSKFVDVVEDRGKLPGQGVDFLIAQSQPGEPGDMQNLFAFNHGVDLMDAPPGASGRRFSVRGRRFARE